MGVSLWDWIEKGLKVGKLKNNNFEQESEFLSSYLNFLSNNPSVYELNISELSDGICYMQIFP
jgi:hypothetical protein